MPISNLDKLNGYKNNYIIENVLITVVVVEGIVSAFLQILHFVFFHAENEDVLHSHFLGHLHVGSVQRTNRQSSVQLQSIFNIFN